MFQFLRDGEATEKVNKKKKKKIIIIIIMIIIIIIIKIIAKKNSSKIKNLHLCCILIYQGVHCCTKVCNLQYYELLG